MHYSYAAQSNVRFVWRWGFLPCYRWTCSSIIFSHRNGQVTWSDVTVASGHTFRYRRAYRKCNTYHEEVARVDRERTVTAYDCETDLDY